MVKQKSNIEIQQFEYSRTYGITAMEGRGFYYPADMAISKDRTAYVLNRGLETDERSVRVTMCNIDTEEYFKTFAFHGEGDGQVIWPVGIDLDSQGNVYISDEYLNRISVFDSSGEFLSKWGVGGNALGELNGPAGIKFDMDDNVYIVDHQNHRIQKFTKDGKFLLEFGSYGSKEGQFDLPWGITIDPKSEIYVADWNNDRIQRFSSDGNFIASYGSSGDGDGQLQRPAGVAVDSHGYIYVADWGNQRLQVFDPDGEFVMKSRGEATISGWAKDFLDINLEESAARDKSNLEPDLDFDNPHEESSHVEKLFWDPNSVLLDGDSSLYVVEGNRHRLQIFERSS